MKQIIVNVDRDLTRVAVLEEGELVELYLEKEDKQRVVGNIYMGRVMNVLPGMQAAFVDIGFQKNAFLFAVDAMSQNTRGQEVPSIKELVKQNAKILVQVEKESIGTKGARVTTDITLPGRFLVLMPSVAYLGISRKIEKEEERSRLKSIIEGNLPEGMGVIVRTVAENVSGEELLSELQFLLNEWDKILKKANFYEPPLCVYQDSSLLYRIVRDLMNDDVAELVIDDQQEGEKVKEILDFVSPHLKERVIFHRNETAIFDFYPIENKIKGALERKVWLKNGGYLIIDSTEALTAIDVNTGKFVGTHNLEDTVLTTNLEAIGEIVRQIRLRNLGGIIIIDFIDMVEAGHQEAILEALKNALKKDRTKNIVMGFTKLGLLEMTRKKSNQPLDQMLMSDCPICNGKGLVLSEESVAKNAEKKIDLLLKESNQEAILLELYPKVAAVLIGSGGENLAYLESKYQKSIFIKGSYYIHPEEIKVAAVGTLKDIEKEANPVQVGDRIKGVIEDIHTIDPSSGIMRVNGYIIQVVGGAHALNTKVETIITEVFKTYAVGKMIIKKY